MLERAWAIGWFPLNQALRLPKGWIRFIGIIVSLPIGLLCQFPAVPFLVCGIVLEMWEEANK
jgi:hypothetical protein